MSEQNSITNENPKQVATEEKRFVEDIKHIVAIAKTQAYRTVNLMQVASNWLLGWRIVEQMQHGQERAEYGAYVIKLASETLTQEFGEGYSVQSLKFYRQFYLTFRDLQIGSTLWNQSQDEKGSTVWSESSAIISQTASELLVKIGQTLPAQITHQDIGQMDMYIRMYDELKCSEGDNPTIGLLLCAETSKDLARYSILKDNQQLFAAKYLTYLPDKKQLLLEIERQKEIFAMQEGKQDDKELQTKF